MTVTVLPATPLVGVKDVMAGGFTKKEPKLEPVPSGDVTPILPVVAPTGTAAVIDVSLSTVKSVAAVLLNFTAVAPVNAVPVIVTACPTSPLVGEKEVTLGAAACVGNAIVSRTRIESHADDIKVNTRDIYSTP